MSSQSSQSCLGDARHVYALCVNETIFRVATSAIIHEEDVESREIPACKRLVDSNESDHLLPRQCIDLNMLSHLSMTAVTGCMGTRCLCCGLVINLLVTQIRNLRQVVEGKLWVNWWILA